MSKPNYLTKTIEALFAEVLEKVEPQEERESVVRDFECLVRSIYEEDMSDLDSYEEFYGMLECIYEGDCGTPLIDHMDEQDYETRHLITRNLFVALSDATHTFNLNDRLTHVKGGDYIVVGTPEDFIIEATNTPAYVYECQETSKCWVRPKDEMEDGRFILMERLS